MTAKMYKSSLPEESWHGTPDDGAEETYNGKNINEDRERERLDAIEGIKEEDSIMVHGHKQDSNDNDNM